MVADTCVEGGGNGGGLMGEDSVGGRSMTPSVGEYSLVLQVSLVVVFVINWWCSVDWAL